MRYHITILFIISSFILSPEYASQAVATSPPPISTNRVEITVEGNLLQGPALAIPGTNLPASSYVVAVNGFDFNLDFSTAPQLASVASSNIGNKVKVTGWLVRKTTETPTGAEIEWFVLEVSGISAI